VKREQSGLLTRIAAPSMRECGAQFLLNSLSRSLRRILIRRRIPGNKPGVPAFSLHVFIMFELKQAGIEYLHQQTAYSCDCQEEQA
jgi:hypothetical protein